MLFCLRIQVIGLLTGSGANFSFCVSLRLFENILNTEYKIQSNTGVFQKEYTMDIMAEEVSEQFGNTEMPLLQHLGTFLCGMLNGLNVIVVIRVKMVFL